MLLPLHWPRPSVTLGDSALARLWADFGRPGTPFFPYFSVQGCGRRCELRTQFLEFTRRQKLATHMRHIFTSESVTEGHPDKMADQISDAVLDAVLAEDPTSRVACETFVTTGLCIVGGEITTSAYVDIPSTVRKTICDIGYDRGSFGYDGN